MLAPFLVLMIHYTTFIRIDFGSFLVNYYKHILHDTYNWFHLSFEYSFTFVMVFHRYMIPSRTLINHYILHNIAPHCDIYI